MSGQSQVAASAAGPSAPPGTAPKLVLTHDILNSLKPARVFKDAVSNSGAERMPNAPPLQITSVAFDDMGERCVTAGEDDVFKVYDARKGKLIKTLYSKKYGIAHARYTHGPHNIIHASTKGDHAIRYHAMHDNKYLAYFQGHTDCVRSLQMSPIDDTFLSAGDDGTVRLWDLRSQACKALVNDVGGSTIAAFDSSGVVFAVACSQTQTIMMYDSSCLDIAPFSHAPLIDAASKGAAFTSLAFSNDGNYLLVATSGNVHYVLDAFDLKVLRRLEGHTGLGPYSGEDVCWSADSNWVISGSADGAIVMWDLSPPKGSSKLEASAVPGQILALPPTIVHRTGDGQRPATRAVAFNPRYAVLGVGGEELSFWLPSQAQDGE